MNEPGPVQSLPSERELVVNLSNFEPNQRPLETTLRTDARVIARVTDGIYRQPGSALRELISNAYDADATRVTIHTDRPRFRRIIIDDDGVGMSPESLVHLLYHIGGSAKRTRAGFSLGITSADNPDRSPGGRPLIGKIGIGLFSVAQLTQAFQIVTKVCGDNYRSIASVALRQYSDAGLSDHDPDATYEAGKVLVWREPASDTESQGTTIVLDAIRPQTRDTLRSSSMWDAISAAEVSDSDHQAEPPRFHIGAVKSGAEDLLQGSTQFDSLPWSSADSPARAFELLVNSVQDLVGRGIPNPSLEKVFDYYLQMIWELSLWVPLRYVENHPFDLTGSDGILAYKLVDGRREEKLDLESAQTVRDAAELGNHTQSPTNFSVQIDDLELRRPIKARDLPVTSGAVKEPLLFVASERQEFKSVDAELSGGTLAFQAYLLWAPKVAPSDHSGVLIRVHNATGTLFDAEFLRFPVAEQRRMAQISCEIFVNEGFDGALNIDRESFNFAHPHAVTLTKWLHSALRRLISIQKRVAATALAERRKQSADLIGNRADAVVEHAWQMRSAGNGTDPPAVVFRGPDDMGSRSTSEAAYIFDRARVVGELTGPNWKGRQELLERKLSQIVKVLAAYDLVDRLSQEEQAELIVTIRDILQAYE